MPKSARAITANGKDASLSCHLVIPDLRLDLAELENMFGVTHYGHKADNEIEAELQKLRNFGCTITEVWLTDSNVQDIHNYAQQHAGIKDLMKKLEKLAPVHPA